MLTLVEHALAQHGWFNIASPYQKSVHLTQGACVWMLLSRDGVLDTHVKFSNRISLLDEGLRCAAAHASYPALTPEFVGHARNGALEILVSRAVDFQGADSAFLLERDQRRGAAADIDLYFLAMPQAVSPPGVAALSNADLVPALLAYFAAHAQAAMAQAWLADGLPACLRALPAMPQHGDLVLNNLGRTKSGRLVIVDWEDFGAVSLPGLDLFTLELALAGDVQKLLANRRQPAAPLSQLVQRSCAAMRLDAAQYQRLAPFYALVFLFLKRNYGPAVRMRMEALAQQLDAHYRQAAANA